MIHGTTVGSGSIWVPKRLGATARFVMHGPKVGTTTVNGQTVMVTSGANVTQLNNFGGTAGAMTSSAGQYWQRDDTELLNGHSAIRSTAFSSKLRVATGGPTGSGPFHLICLGRMMSQPGAGQNNSTFMLAGPPGNGGGINNAGIGCVAASNGLWTLVGGQGNNVAQGSNLPRATFDTDIHVFELISDGTQIIMLRDGGLLGVYAGACTLSTGEMGLQGWYPLDSYGPPDTRIWWAGWFNRELTTAERRLLFLYLKREFALVPKRFVSATGDSITAGNIASVSTTSFLIQLQLQYAGLGVPETIYIDNKGISSQPTTVIAARSPSTFVRDYSTLGYREQFLIINGSKNDDQATETPAQAYANLAAISVAAQALGVRTVMTTAFLGTPAQRTTSTTAWVVALNTLITGNACGADLVANYWVDNSLADPQLAVWTDTVHPNNVGLASMATVLRGVLG